MLDDQAPRLSKGFYYTISLLPNAPSFEKLVGMLQDRVVRRTSTSSSTTFLHVKGKGKLNASLNVVNLLRKGVHFKEMIDINNLKIAASGRKEVGLYHIGLKWLFKTKYHIDGTLDKLKALLVIKGYSQMEGVD